jgi:uncharacterized protein Yka (UPF0111/DUF47 family)
MELGKNQDDRELFALANTTDRVADNINDVAIKLHLRAVAEEVRALARRTVAT